MEDFESGDLGSYWMASSTAAGRVRVTGSADPYSGNFHLTMDSARRGSRSRNELVLTIDLLDQSGVILGFQHKEFKDENHSMPSSFTGSHNSDGIAISADGSTWYKVQGLTSTEGISADWQRFEVDLDAAIVAAGIDYNENFRIKFQQYDNYPLGTDGFAFDDIEVFLDIADMDPDGLPNDWELLYFGDLSEGPNDDYDGDGLTNLDEFQRGTDPTENDTDQDQMPDAFEVQYGLDPLDPADAEGDLNGNGITNLEEYLAGSDPTLASDAAMFPFVEDFESGDLGSYWTASSTATGRVQVTPSAGPYSGNSHLTMDSDTDGSFALNELVLTIDLLGQSGVKLSFHHKEFRDENHFMPNSFMGSHNSDGVAISADGSTWYKLQGLTSTESISANWKKFEVDLDAAIATAGISYNENFRIKFQQYDNYPLGTDGFAFDDIELDVLQPGSGGSGNGGNDLVPEEQEVVVLINDIRAQRGLAPLTINQSLVAVARRHSRDMATNDFMSHTGSDGSSPWDRMRDAGYQLGRGGENVAAGYSTAAGVVDGWMNSTGHRENMLSPSFCDLGVGYAYNGKSTYRHYWTLDLGCQQ